MLPPDYETPDALQTGSLEVNQRRLVVLNALSSSTVAWEDRIIMEKEGSRSPNIVAIH